MEQTEPEDIRVLRAHLASEHKNAAAFELAADELEEAHRSDHFGPGGIRNHDITDRSYSTDAIATVMAEAAEMAGATTTVILECSDGESAPIEIVSREPDEWYNYAVEADPADVERWRKALADYTQAQQEMRTAWQVKRDAAVAEEERERAASMAELRAEQEAARLEQERLDVEIGPREWVWTTRKLARREYMKVAHKIGCSSAQTREGYGPGARLGDMVNTLLKAGLNERIDAYNRGLTICGRCGGPLALAYREADAERKAATYREALEKQG